jgi:tetratricopeptide (TPR) repeat protein/tRNA A-37 threonylcarbamoyl transferase component Bud32
VRIGPYEVVGELGRGARGVVYRVRTPTGHDAALKLLDRAEGFARFERERRLLGTLGEEAGFVGLLDAGVEAGNRPWLVMPFVPGGTLRRRLEAGPLGVAETVALGTELARALGRAHERGIVHRDVKPENILFTATGRPLLADLGLAKHFDDTAKGASQSVEITGKGAFKGTAAYMAPEQMADAANARPAADVFALGAILYECLAGRPAFHGVTFVELLSRVTVAALDPIGRRDVPASLEAAIRRALVRDPAVRFADGAAFARGLVPGKRRSLLAPLLGGTVAGALALAAALALARRPATGVSAAHEPAARALALDPTSALAWARRGRASLDKGDVAGAVADETRAIELDPALAEAWANRALARYSQRDWDGMIADSAKAIELDPTSAIAWSTLGYALSTRGDVEGTIAATTQALALDPTLAAAWHNRGDARAQKGDVQGSIDDETRAIELAPGLAAAWANRALERRMIGDLTGELSDAAKAIELDPTLSRAWEIHGAARGEGGDLDGAIADFTKAIELDPLTVAAWSNRGIALYSKHDYPGAIRDLGKALELDPRSRRNAQLRQLLEEARKRAR